MEFWKTFDGITVFVFLPDVMCFNKMAANRWDQTQVVSYFVMNSCDT